MITISGGIFNFTQHGYTAPTWSGSEVYNFTKKVTSLYQIYTNDSFIFSATNKGLDIYNIASENICAFINRPEGFTTVAGNTLDLYLGTPSDGVKILPMTCVSGNEDAPYDLSSYLSDLNIERITSNYINYIHAADNTVGISTSSGIDFLIRYVNPEIHSKTFIQGTKKCFVTNKSVYYITEKNDTSVSGTIYQLNVVDTCLTDWLFPDRAYTTGSGIFEKGIELTDLYITTGTALRGGNTIFCATTSGVYIIDDDTKNYAIFYTVT